MVEPNDSERSTVLVERAAFEALVRASRRNVDLAYAAGGIAMWAAFVLAYSEGAITAWVAVVGVIGDRVRRLGRPRFAASCP